MKKLLNCPFCGNNRISKGYREEDMSSRYGVEIHYLECDKCGCRIEYDEIPYSSGKTDEKKIESILNEKWNTRVNKR